MWLELSQITYSHHPRAFVRRRRIIYDEGVSFYQPAKGPLHSFNVTGDSSKVSRLQGGSES